METRNNTERRTLTVQEISVIRTTVQLLKTIEHNEMLSREQLLNRIALCYHDLLESCIAKDEFVNENFNRLEGIKERLIQKYIAEQKKPEIRKRE